MAADKHLTENGEGIRTLRGWVWLCRHCSVSTRLEGLDLEDLDVDRWLGQVDAMHYCWHKDGETA